MGVEEKLIHYYFDCDGRLDQKYLLLFCLIKLNIIYGKTIIKVNNVDEGYKVKVFMSRFGVAGQVLNPEMPVNTQRSVLTSFTLAHFDYLIILGNERGLNLKHVRNAIFFNIAANYGEYSKVVNMVAFEEGYILTMINGKEQTKQLNRLQERQRAHLGGVLFSELPVKKHILESFRYRVNDALKSITSKVVKGEKAKELKKQILGSKKLKKYFADHPEEKEILNKNLSKYRSQENRFADLKTIPDYLIPKESLIANPIEEAIREEKGESAIPEDTAKLFPGERPEVTSFEELAPTSGRKRWKIRHHRRLKKKPQKRDINFVA